MIIMINGAFGAGKTTVATLLNEQLPNSMIYDPEEVGFLLRNVTAGVLTPSEMTDDFQDIALWPELVVTVGKRLYQQYGRSLIVPMTITNPTYFTTIRNGLAQVAPLHHFCLVANATTLQQRLLKRGNVEGTWCFQQIPRCITAFQSDLFAQHVDTNHLVPEQITTRIMALLND